MEQNSNEIKKPVVETYAEDMAKVIENDKGGGLIKKLIHGEEEHEKEKISVSPEARQNRFFIFGSAILALLAMAILAFLLSKEEAPSVPVEKQFIPLIFHDGSVFKEVAGYSKDQVIQTVMNEVRDSQVKRGGIEGIYLTSGKQMIGLRGFIALIKANFVPESNPILVYDNFLLGVVNNDTEPAFTEVSSGKDFFIILKMRSLADIFDSLRAWEPKMWNDLHGFFGMDIAPETKYLLLKEFENGIIENKNARILYKDDGNIAMMYILANDNSVVITNTREAAREVILRLAASQVKK